MEHLPDNWSALISALLGSYVQALCFGNLKEMVYCHILIFLFFLWIKENSNNGHICNGFNI
jgi:hypothetical protein